ncbi:hypothetical protein B0H16DRAFT_1452753 [Mycena metata]|uniref:Uncharacterized protein n=1 Tax=Mycena metata TaxID=1033252 RepID=A0AAD7NPE8_9AGAR|nr:hypothetical protein B0H16DRAFT_1452753 [Mycena metata]
MTALLVVRSALADVFGPFEFDSRPAHSLSSLYLYPLPQGDLPYNHRTCSGFSGSRSSFLATPHGGTGEEREHKQMDADDNNYKLIEQIGQEYWGVKWSPRKIDTWCKGSQWTRKSLRRRRGCTGWSNAVRRQVTTEGVEATMVPDDSTARVMG